MYIFFLAKFMFTGRFRGMLQFQKCDWMNIKLNTYRVLMSWMLVNLSMLIPWIHFTTHFIRLHNSFTLLSHKLMWQEYEGDQWVLIQGEKRPQMVVRFQLSFLLRWTKTKMNGKVKNVKFTSNMTITETIVLTCLHLKFFPPDQM